MATNNASGSYSGTGFTVSVTVCNLDTDLTIVDYLPFFNGVPGNPNLFTKTSPTVLTYIGASLGVATTIIIQRRTPNITRTGLVTFASRFSSDAWNKEVDRTVRHSEEYALNGIGPGSVVIAPIPQDTAYPTGWFGDTTYSATRNALFNILTTLAPITSPSFFGNPTVINQTLGDSTTRIANTAFVQSALAGYATLGSPSFTGNPTVLTQVTSDNSTKIANTAFVQNNLTLYAPLVSPLFTGTPTIPGASIGFTQNVADTTSHLATTAFVSFSNRPVLRVNKSTTLQTVNNAVFTTVLWDVVTQDSSSGGYASGTGLFTVPTGQGGLYSASCGFALNNSCSVVLLQAVINGAASKRMQDTRAGSDILYGCYGTATFLLVAGDTIGIQVFQTNSVAAARSIPTGSPFSNWLELYRLNT